MKKIYSFTAAVLALLAFAGCQQEIEQDQSLTESGNVVFSATLDAADTKMVLDYEKKLSVWSGEEYISILNGTQNLTFKADVPTPSETAKFTCTMEAPADLSEVVAMYPCKDYTLDKENKVVSGVYVPSSQSSVAGTYDVNAAVSMAYTTDRDLHFKNAVALIRFSLTEQGIWSVSLKANGGETLCGLHSLAWNDGEPAFVLNEPGEEKSGYDAINFWPSESDGGSFKVGEYYYMAVIPGEYSGFTVSINNVESYVVDEARTLERNKIYNLNDLTLPAAESWGICGTMNAWGEETPDLTPTKEDENWWIYENVTVGMTDAFQFRADNEWGRQLGYNNLVKSDVEIEFTGDRIDIHSYDPGIYDIYLAKDLASFKMVKTGDPEGLPAERAWGVCGSMTSWGGAADAPVQDIAMTVEGNLYIAKDVTLYNTDAFKFRVGNLWDVNFGCGLEPGNTVIPGFAYAPVEEGTDIAVYGNGIYDIHLSRYEDAFRLVLKESLPDPEPEPGVNEKSWGITGVVTGWAAPDIPLQKHEENLFVAYNVELLDGGFKIRANEVWEDDANYGLASAGTISAGYFYQIITSNGSANINVVAGTYDIWFDLRDPSFARLYLMTPGSDISQVSQGTPIPPDTSTWYLVGDFNGWATGDINYEMEFDGTWYIFRNFVSEGNLLKFNAGGWDVNRGGNFAEGGFVIVQAGANLSVPAGTYDIYMNAATDKAYFCAPGTKPAV